MALAGCAAGAVVVPTCCEDPAAFPFQALPERGQVEARIDRGSPYSSSERRQPSPPLNCRARPCPISSGSEPVRCRIPGTVFYPVMAVLRTFIVLRLTGLDNLRVETALATPGARPDSRPP